ncbi:MAG TPA: HAD family hydrolase [Candidatus Microsaccharimonas sp.]|jgi:HAD superfamily hydrolase (TIGR01509 family)
MQKVSNLKAFCYDEDMSKYKLLILDYGGVYSFGYDVANFGKIMQKVFGREPTSFEKADISLLSRKLGANEIDSSEYVKAVTSILGVKGVPTTELFEDTTISVTAPPSPEMMELVQKVRMSGIKVSLLSDMYEFEIKKTRPMGRYDGLDYVSLSAEIGLIKRDPKALQTTLDYFQFKPDEALFVDDVHEYTNNASSLGIDVIWADKNIYKNPIELVQKILDELNKGV